MVMCSVNTKNSFFHPGTDGLKGVRNETKAKKG